MNSQEDRDRKPASVRAAEAIAEAELAAAEQARALAAAQELALKAAQAQAQAEQAAREAAEAEEAAMREAQQDFPKITFAEQLREVEEAKEAAITRVEVHRRNHGAGHERECSINAHSRPSGPLKLQPRGAQQHRNGWHSHASDGDHHHHATTHEAVSRADQATCWRRTKNEPCSGQLHVKLLASSPKPERLAWNDMPLAASKHSSSPSDSRASASTLLVSSTSQVVAGACSLAGPPQAGAAGVLTATAGSSTSRNQAWHASVEAASKPQTLEQIQAQEEGSRVSRMRIQQLLEMGFPAAVAADTLVQCGGDVHAAIAKLTSTHGQSRNSSGAQPSTDWKPSGTLQVIMRQKDSIVDESALASSGDMPLGPVPDAVLQVDKAECAAKGDAALPCPRTPSHSLSSYEHVRERAFEHAASSAVPTPPPPRLSGCSYAGMSYEEAKRAVFARAEVGATKQAIPHGVTRRDASVLESKAQARHPVRSRALQGSMLLHHGEAATESSPVILQQQYDVSSSRILRLPTVPPSVSSAQAHKGLTGVASGGAMSLTEKVQLIKAELVLQASLPMAAAILEANAQMGLVGEGPLPDQADHLLSVMGLPR